jgi:Flp pilus assembly protein TadD
MDMAAPAVAEGLTALAIALAEEGHIAEAIEADRAALQRRPDDETALSHLAQLKRFTTQDPDSRS